MKGILITGIDTGVGKTYTALQLINAAQTSELRVSAMKPFETGCTVKGKNLIPQDAVQLMNKCGTADIDMVNQYRLKAPTAPFIAAMLEHKIIDLKKVFRAYAALASRSDIIIVEGAGGLLVPITKDFSFADLAKELSLMIVVVSSNKLGVINHTMLTVDCITSHGLKLLGVVLNNIDRKDDIAKTTNARALFSLLGKKFIGETRYNNQKQNTVLYEKIINMIQRQKAWV